MLLTIRNFTYEMVDNQGKIAMEGDFRKHRAGCPLLPTRPVGNDCPISLVKSDGKLQPENPSPALVSRFPFLRSATPPSNPDKMDFCEQYDC